MKIIRIFAAAVLLLSLPAWLAGPASADPQHRFRKHSGHGSFKFVRVDRRHGYEYRQVRRTHRNRPRHARRYRHRYAPARFSSAAIVRGRCDRQFFGALLGGGAGALAGSAIGRGSGRVAATIGGAVLGVIVGGSLGRDMDLADRRCVGLTLEHAGDGRSVAWSAPQGGGYTVRPVRSYRTNGRYCREYLATATIGGREQQTYGTACRQPDGSWELQG